MNVEQLSQQNIEYTASDALTEALTQAGVSFIFLNSGTDYPPLIESWAKFKDSGRAMPEIIISPHETVAMSAAQGAAQLTGQAQAVCVHVDVGTQNIGGALHNAYRCRIPVYIFSGLSPYTMEGELKGGRNAQIQFIQNVSDQAGIVREYTKMNYEYHSGQNIQQMTYRALQIAQSDPKGPVYCMATREVLEEAGRDIKADQKHWSPVSPGGIDNESLEVLTEALAAAQKPLIITSYLGRNTQSVAELIKLSERLAIPVVEMYQSYMNFPANHPMHLGFDSDIYLKEADLILVIDCDMPWIPANTRPKDDCRIFYIDTDPLKEHIPLWYIPSERFMKADSHTALKQLNTRFDRHPPVTAPTLIRQRRGDITKIHTEARAAWKQKEAMGETMTAEYLTACLREITDEDTIILSEAITDRPVVDRHLPRTKPGTLFASGGSSLGWHGGAAIGMKLVQPDKDVIALTGDGTYIFSCPTAVYWMARKYQTPFMTVIYNNQGWNAPKMITCNEHPDGRAVNNDCFWTSFAPAARLDLVAEAAGGAYARTVADPKELKAVLQEGREAVKNGTPAVINVLLPPV
jgi:acetolactate synthase-1/2/3 large subunit